MTNSPSPVGSPRTISTACYSTSLSSRIDPDTHQPCRRQILAASITAVLAQSLSLLGPAAQAASGITDDELREIVHLAFEKTAGKSKAPVLLRLVFHDAGTFSSSQGQGGANASVRFELKRPENSGLNRAWKVIELAKQELKGTPAESRVSYADLIALGGAYAVAVTGGPNITVELGRNDATKEDPWGRLPSETASASELLSTFKDKGFSVAEFVALSGAHTLGNKGFGDPVTFDNTYYKTLLEKPWNDKRNSMASMIGLPSDHILPESSQCLPAIEKYANSSEDFFRDFAAAYGKLTNLGVSRTTYV